MKVRMHMSGAVWQPKGTFGKCHMHGTRSGISLWIGLDWAGPGRLWEKRHVCWVLKAAELGEVERRARGPCRSRGPQPGRSSIFSSLIYNWSGPQSPLQTHSSHAPGSMFNSKFSTYSECCWNILIFSSGLAKQWHMIFLKHQHISAFLSVSYLFSFQHLFTYLWFFSVSSVNVK